MSRQNLSRRKQDGETTSIRPDQLSRFAQRQVCGVGQASGVTCAVCPMQLHLQWNESVTAGVARRSSAGKSAQSESPAIKSTWPERSAIRSAWSEGCAIEAAWSFATLPYTRLRTARVGEPARKMQLRVCEQASARVPLHPAAHTATAACMAGHTLDGRRAWRSRCFDRFAQSGMLTTN